MATIVSCPKCRDQVTLPPEPYSGLICPHCQVEFSMQPTLRQQPQNGPYTALRQELAREMRGGLGLPQRAAAEAFSLAEVGDQVLALPRRRSPGILAIVFHVVGLLGGSALGLVAGYCALTYWGGTHFNVLDLPLPWLTASNPSPSDDSAKRQGKSSRPGDAAPAHDMAAAGKFPSPASPRPDATTSAARGGPQLTPANPAATPVGHAAASSSAATPTVPGTATPRRKPDPTTPDDAAGDTQRVAITQTAIRAAAHGPLRVESRRVSTDQVTSTHYSSDDLSQAAKAARDALACPTCKSTGLAPRSPGGHGASQRCPVCRGLGGAGVTADVYGKLCHLAEVATHADGDDPGVLKAQQELASVFRKAADRPEKQAAIGRRAAQRMAAAQRTTLTAADARGILLVGTVERKEQAGGYHTTRLVLLGEPTAVVVLSRAAVPFAPGQRAIIAGSIVVDPVRELANYAGPRDPAVWGGMPLRLEEPE